MPTRQGPSSRLRSRTALVPLVSLIAAALTSACGEKRSPAELLAGLRDVAELATVEVEVSKIVVLTRQRQILFLRTGTSRHVAESTGTVKLGVDLGELSEGDLTVEGRRIEVDLPPVTVVEFDYSASNFVVRTDLSVDRFLSGIDQDEVEGAYRSAETELQSALNYSDLRDVGEEYTENLVRLYLLRLGFEEVAVTFRETDTPLFVGAGAP